MKRKDPSERQVFDFETNTWVFADSFNTRDQGREIVLEAPETAPAEGRWRKPPAQKKPTPLLQILLAWTAITLFVIGLALHSVLLVMGCVVCVLLMAILSAASESDEFRLTDADRQLLEDPDDRDVCLVAVTIVRDGDLIGKDKGVVWFADGMLLFSGHRTSFAIGGEDVLPYSKWEGTESPGLHSESGDRVLPLRVKSGTAVVGFNPLTGRNVTSPNEMRFLKQFYAFRRRPPLSKGARQWPPFDR